MLVHVNLCKGQNFVFEMIIDIQAFASCWFGFQF